VTPLLIDDTIFGQCPYLDDLIINLRLFGVPRLLGIKAGILADIIGV